MDLYRSSSFIIDRRHYSQPERRRRNENLFVTQHESDISKVRLYRSQRCFLILLLAISFLVIYFFNTEDPIFAVGNDPLVWKEWTWEGRTGMTPIKYDFWVDCQNCSVENCSFHICKHLFRYRNVQLHILDISSFSQPIFSKEKVKNLWNGME